MCGRSLRNGNMKIDYFGWSVDGAVKVESARVKSVSSRDVKVWRLCRMFRRVKVRSSGSRVRSGMQGRRFRKNSTRVSRNTRYRTRKVDTGVGEADRPNNRFKIQIGRASCRER